MYRHRDIVAESMVVQHVDGEEKCDVNEPSANRNPVRLEEKWWPRYVELRDVSSGSNEDELDECEKCACECESLYVYEWLSKEHVPLFGFGLVLSAVMSLIQR